MGVCCISAFGASIQAEDLGVRRGVLGVCAGLMSSAWIKTLEINA